MKYPEGKLFKMMREYAGLTLVQLGKKTSLSKAALSKLENGEADVIGPKSRKRLLKFLLKAIDDKQEREKRFGAMLDSALFTSYRAASLADAFDKERNRLAKELTDHYEEQLAQEEQEAKVKA